MITKKTQNARLKSAIAAAGKRYDTSVNLPVRSMFSNLHALNRDPQYISGILRLTYKISRKKGLDYVVRENQHMDKDLSAVDVDLNKIIDRLHSLKSLDKNKNISWSRLQSSLDKVSDKIYEQYDNLRSTEEEKKKKNPNTTETSYSHELWSLYRAVNDLSYYIRDQKTKLFNKPRMVLTGEAGIGKTHLLCDYAKERLTTDKPTLIFLSHELLGVKGSKDPIDRMSKLLGYKNTKSFLKELEKSANESDSRFCIVVDAINEADGINWDKLIELHGIKGVSLVISLRNGYEFLISEHEKYTQIEHSGFAEMEWDAVPEFFNEYGLKLPEIPIIDPEFKNPLFLRIFCTAYSDKRKTPRGNGATDAFEQYIEHQSKAIYTELGLTGIKNDHLWNYVIKRMGVWMGRNTKDRVLKPTLIRIVKQDKTLEPHANQLVTLMERHGLLVKYPHYSNAKRIGYKYKFAYNRFSDHIIVRSVLSENGIQGSNASKKAKDFFNKNTFLERTINEWDQGLIEALAIQIPERCKGDELVWLGPKEYRDNQIMKTAFLEGLKWRNVSTIDKKTNTLKFINTDQVLKYMNIYLVGYEKDFFDVIATMLDVSAIPRHPFNAERLHKHLLKQTLPKRDAWLQEFFTSHHNYAGSAVGRMHSWSFSNLSDKASNDSVLLASIALAWTLGSTDRALRDRSTRALIALLKDRQDVLLKLISDYFSYEDDPYILERLLAVAYGAVSLNPKDKDDFKRLVVFMYQDHFLNESRTPNALIDDYAKGIIELYLRNYRNDVRVRRNKITPPFKYYSFPKRIPTTSSLKKKYRDSDDNYYSLWGSLMYGEGESLADFGNYTLGAALRSFTKVSIGTKAGPTDRERLDKFEKSLNKKQKALLETYNTRKFLHSVAPIGALNEFDKTFEKPTKKEVNNSLRNFEKSLSFFKMRIYRKLKKYISGDLHLPGSYESYDLNIARRWIFQRVIKLGWNPKDHLEFDQSRGSYDRLQPSSSERIGKKYQWIGLFEFAAILGSNYYYLDDNDWNNKKLVEYEGAFQLSIRDLDPTIDPRWLMNRSDKSDDAVAWWLPAYKAWNIKNWKFSTEDIPKLSEIVEVQENSRDFLNLYSRITWDGPKDRPEDEDSYDRPQLWMHITAYIVKKKDLAGVLEWFKDKEFWNNRLPEINDYSSGVFLKEMVDSSAYKKVFNPYRDVSGWVKKNEESNPFDMLVPIEAYNSSSYDLDKSMSDQVRVYVPSGFLRKKMKLKPSKKIGAYGSLNEDLIAYDPSVSLAAGYETILVDKQAFLEMLNREKLTLCWTILAEKLYFGRKDYRGQRLEVHGYGHLEKDGRLIENIRHKNEWSEES